MPWLENRLIQANERATGEDGAYLRDVLEGGRAGFWKFMLAMPMVAHRKHADKTLWHLARIAATRFEDCGHCLQTSIRMAINDGVDADVLKTALGQSPGVLSQHQQAAMDLGRMIAGGDLMDEAARQAFQSDMSDAAFSELVLTCAAVRLFPAVKRGMGYFTSCALVQAIVDAA